MATETTNQIGEVIDINKAACREFNLNEIHKYVRMATNGGLPLSWSWGFKSPIIMVKDKALRFTVRGHHHKGHVHIVLNGADLFDIYYCSSRGVIKKISKDIFIENLVETLDDNIEYIPEYKH
jgi:hypothetical protein